VRLTKALGVPALEASWQRGAEIIAGSYPKRGRRRH